MANKDTPSELKITEKELGSLFARLESNTLTQADKQLLKDICHFLIWMQKRYEAGRLTIHNLRRLLFGNRSEKRQKSKEQENKGSEKVNPVENPQILAEKN